jgi:Domain of unknown function (DUF4178)
MPIPDSFGPSVAMQSHACQHCTATHEYPAKLRAQHFVCSACGHAAHRAEAGWVLGEKKPFVLVPPLSLGQRAEFDGEVYTIAGIAELIPFADSTDFWQEYLLVGQQGARAFLSESSGHWVFLKETKNNCNVWADQASVSVGDGSFIDLKEFSTYQIHCRAASGFFDFPLWLEAQATEYTAPPQHLVIETRGEERSTFLGHYVTQNQIETAFQQKINFPPQIGVGASQPPFFAFDLVDFYKFFGALAAVFLGLLLLSGAVSREEELFSYREIMRDSLFSRPVISPSFDLARRAPLEIYVTSNVNNDWVEYDLELIDERTLIERNVSIGAEFWSGTDSDGYWTEDSAGSSFTLCEVPPGRYHFVLSPIKVLPDADVFIRITTGRWYMANELYAIFACLAACIVVYFLHIQHEGRRHYPSNFE